MEGIFDQHHLERVWDATTRSYVTFDELEEELAAVLADATMDEATS